MYLYWGGKLWKPLVELPLPLHPVEVGIAPPSMAQATDCPGTPQTPWNQEGSWVDMEEAWAFRAKSMWDCTGFGAPALTFPTNHPGCGCPRNPVKGELCNTKEQAENNPGWWCFFLAITLRPTWQAENGMCVLPQNMD